jgi:hypothetical protein
LDAIGASLKYVIVRPRENKCIEYSALLIAFNVVLGEFMIGIVSFYGALPVSDTLPILLNCVGYLMTSIMYTRVCTGFF